MPYKNLQCNIEPIGFDVTNKPVCPSDKVYYDRYPYKICLGGLTIENKRQGVFFKRQIEDFEYDLCDHKVKGVLGQGKNPNIYVQDHNDLKIACGIFKSQITEVHGPLDEEHIKFLTTKDHFIQLRKTKYFQQYDCKVYLCDIIPRSWQPGGSLYGYSSPAIKKVDTKPLMEFFESNIDGIKIRKSYYYGQGRESEFYCNYQDYAELIPWVRMNFEDIRNIVRKVMIK